MTYVFFFVAVRHSQKEQVIEDLEQYIDPSSSYIIALEISKHSHQDISGEHFHFAIKDMTDKQYDAYRKTILVKKYQLRGQAKDGLSRQYGRTKKVRDETKFLAYTVKDNNYICKNIFLHNIQEYIDASYPRNDKFDFTKDLFVHLQKMPNLYIKTYTGTAHSTIDFYPLEKEVLDFHMKHPYNIKSNKILLLNKLRYYVLSYLQTFHIHFVDCILSYLHNPQIL